MCMEHEALCKCQSNTADFSRLNNLMPAEAIKKSPKGDT
jgi:hypothetical protein